MATADQLAPVAAYLASECGFARGTIAAYIRELELFAAFLHEHDAALSAITSDLVDAYIRHLSAKGMAATTINLRLAIIRFFLRFQQTTGVDAAPIIARIDSIPTERNIPNVLGRQQVEDLIGAVPDSALRLRDTAILETLYATGMRASELCNVKIADVDLEGGWIRVFGKGDKDRLVPLGEAAITAIRLYLRLQRPAEAEYLFLSLRGRQLTRGPVGAIVGRARVASGIAAKATPHTLRHSFASHLLAGGANLRVIQQFLGHESVTTTQIYLHTDLAHLKKIHSLLGR